MKPQPMNGNNGSYDICGPCGTGFGHTPDHGIGVWSGTCAICGDETWVANGLHDFWLTDEDVEVIVRETGRLR